jgi:CubicO group peptidase (beta-lactamase class C family)
MRPRYASALAACLALILLWSTTGHGQASFGWVRFEQYVESLRQQTRIPGLSAAILKDHVVVWERGFGFQDLDGLVRATPDTAYHVVGLTQPLSTALVLDCVSRGRLDLGTPVRGYTDVLGESDATLAHLLTHTSDEVPGSAYRFDLARFAALTPAIERCYTEREPRSYRELLAKVLLDRLGMTDSLPGENIGTPEVVERLPENLFDEETMARYAGVLTRLAKPYAIEKNRAVPAEYPIHGIDAGSGLVTTVRDLARFDAALDDLVLLDEETIARMWTPPQAQLPRLPLFGPTLPVPLPHAQGWFVQTYEGRQLVWQFGRWTGVTSSLVLKVPDEQLTFIVLANSDGLAAGSDFESGDVTQSLFARLFLKFFL